MIDGDDIAAATRRSKVVEAFEEGDHMYQLLGGALLGALLERADGRIEVTDEELTRAEARRVIVFYDAQRAMTVYALPPDNRYEGEVS